MVTHLAPGMETLGKESELIVMGKELLLCQPSSHCVSVWSVDGNSEPQWELCHLHWISLSIQTHPIPRTQSSLTQLLAIWNSVSCQRKRLLRHLINHDKDALIQNHLDCVKERMEHSSRHRMGQRELTAGGWASGKHWPNRFLLRTARTIRHHLGMVEDRKLSKTGFTTLT